jgi:transcriptional regulator with XRE-family HTH domain
MDRLAEFRERRALTLRELSRMSGVAADTINQIELGHRKARPSTLRKLAKALEVDVEEFYAAPALSGKADASATGRSLTDKVLDAVRLDEEKDARAMARLQASEGVLRTTAVSEYAKDELRAELRGLPFDELFDEVVLPLAQIAHRAKQLERATTDQIESNKAAFVDSYKTFAEEMAKRNVRQ